MALDTLRLFDSYSVFYHAYLLGSDKKLYADTVKEILDKHGVSATVKESIAAIQRYLQKKFLTFTKEGKDRKGRIAEKVFVQRKDVLATIHTYIHVLPAFKKYVLLFQQKEPAMHHLHPKQHELFNEFCSAFLTPESLSKMPHKIDIEDSANQKSIISLPHKASQLFQRDSSGKKQLEEKLKKGYVAGAKKLQEKMPVKNMVLKACAALDPQVRKTTTAERHLKTLAKAEHLVSKEDIDDFNREVDKYCTKPSIPNSDVEKGSAVIDFWARNTAEFLLIAGIARKLLSVFHDPQVESSFSSMGEILDPGSSRMDISTYAAMQTVRYTLVDNGMTAVQYFKRKDPVREPVAKGLALKMQAAWRVNEGRREANKDTRMERRTQLGASLGKKTSKRTEKEKLLEEEIVEEPLTSLGKKTSKRTEKEKRLEEEIVEEPPTSRRVNPQKRVLEKTRQKSVGPAEKRQKLTVTVVVEIHHSGEQQVPSQQQPEREAAESVDTCISKSRLTSKPKQSSLTTFFQKHV